MSEDALVKIAVALERIANALEDIARERRAPGQPLYRTPPE